MSKVAEIRNVMACDNSPNSIADMMVDLVRDICEKIGKDPAEGTVILLLAAMKIYHNFARDPQQMPEGLSTLVKEMAEVYLKELEGTRQ